MAHLHPHAGADSGNYLSFFKRATVFLALGRLKQATRDLDTVLELKPDFEQARSRRADANLKLGNFQAAREDYETIVCLTVGVVMGVFFVLPSFSQISFSHVSLSPPSPLSLPNSPGCEQV